MACTWEWPVHEDGLYLSFSPFRGGGILTISLGQMSLCIYMLSILHSRDAASFRSPYSARNIRLPRVKRLVRLVVSAAMNSG